jgi:thioredoxin-related protein
VHSIKGRIFAVCAAAAVFMMPAVSRLSAAELVMFERKGCSWCVVWNKDVAPGYANTTEGKRAPLRRVDTRAARPADLAHVQVSGTPTFVLMDKGREVGRIDGYMSSMFFWAQLDELIDKLPPSR